MARGITNLLFIVSAFISPQAVNAPSAHSITLTSICEIRKNPDSYVGKVVAVSAIYKTDSNYYEYLIASDCSKGNVLAIGFSVPEKDNSVESFTKAQAAECDREGQQGLCVLEADVVMQGEIARTKDAHLQPDLVHLIINPHSVLSYKFRSER